jgi:hypothetical protein
MEMSFEIARALKLQNVAIEIIIATGLTKADVENLK